MRDHIHIGSVPNLEKCAAVGVTPNASAISRIESAYYRKAIIAHYGPPPGNVVIAVKANPHDFGTYYALEAYFDYKDDDTTEVDYCYRIEEGIDEWPEDIKAEMHKEINAKFNMNYQEHLNTLS